MQQTLLGLSLVINIILGVFIFYRGLLKSSVVLRMAGSIFFLVLWTVGDYLLLFGRSDSGVKAGLWLWTVMPMVGVLFLYSFARVFERPFSWPYEKTAYRLLLLVAACWIVYFALWPAKAVARIMISAGGQNVLTPGSQLLAYALFFSLYFSASLLLLYLKFRDASGLIKMQLQYIFLGIGMLLLSATVSNLLLPILGHNLRYLWLGPTFSVFYASAFTYAILRHKLFDINRLLARSLTYLMLVASLALILAVALVSITAVFFQKQNFSLSFKLVYVTLALLVAFIFQPLKRRFDKLTTRIFYRDYYDPQEVLDRLSNHLVVSSSTNDIQAQAAAVLKSALKPSYIRFLLESQAGGDRQYAKFVYHLMIRRSGITVKDNLKRRDQALIGEMDEAGAAVAVRLHAKDEILGLILLGHKQTGTPYTEADLKLLKIAADEIAISLQNALRFEEIQQFNLTLQDKIDKATKKLSHANIRLKELDQTKDEFISMASHQLRTPLTTVKGYLSMVLDGDAGKVNATEREMLQSAYASADNMVALIADLLNVSRLQSGKFTIDNQPTDLAKIVKDQLRQLAEQAQSRNIKLSLDLTEDIPSLSLDETKIRQVVMNFLDNALYYTPPGGSVVAALEASKTNIKFTVSDTGVGVPAAVQHHLFSKFYRADNAKKMRPDGTGLGLYMAKKVIAAQGGAIIFKSREGHGSTFGFSLPRTLEAYN